MKVTISVQGDKEVRREFKRVRIEIAKKIKKETYASGLEILTLAKKNLKAFEAWDTGFCASSITADKVDGGESVEVGPEAPYGVYIETGTRPHFPPPDALEEWARRHGMESAWPICIAISKRGTEPRPYLEPAYLEVVKEYIRRVEGILERSTQ